MRTHTLSWQSITPTITFQSPALSTVRSTAPWYMFNHCNTVFYNVLRGRLKTWITYDQALHKLTDSAYIHVTHDQSLH